MACTVSHVGGGPQLHLVAGMTGITAALLITTVVAVSVPIGLVALVSVASRHEDAEWTLGGPPPGLTQAIARRVLGVYVEGELPSPRRHASTRPPVLDDARLAPPGRKDRNPY
jgi:hypothetical protein